MPFASSHVPVPGQGTFNVDAKQRTTGDGNVYTERMLISDPNSDVDLTVDPTSNAARVTPYDTNGNKLLTDNTGTGTLTTTGDIIGPVRVDGRTVLWVQLVPTTAPIGTVRVQGSLDGTTFFDIYAYQATAVATSGGPVLSLDPTGTNRYVVPIGGLQKVQVKANSLSGGTSTVTMNLGQGSLPYQPTILTGAKGRQASVNDAGALAAAIVDGTSGTAANVDSNHALTVIPHDANGSNYQLATGDGLSGTDLLAVANVGFNGTTFDLPQNGRSGTVFPSAARTGVVSSAVFTRPQSQDRGIIFGLEVSAKAGATTLQFDIRNQDPIVASAGSTTAPPAAVAATLNTYCWCYVYPGALSVSVGGTSLSGVAAMQIPIPRQWVLVMIPSDNSSVTYSVSYQYVQ